MQVDDEDKGPDMTATTWTIAYRKRTANRFLRVASWSGTWAQANALAGLFATSNPTLDVFYVPTAASEVNGASEDAGNILTDSGKRVRVVDTDIEVAAELLDRIPGADVAQQRWNAGVAIADPEPVAVCPRTHVRTVRLPELEGSSVYVTYVRTIPGTMAYASSTTVERALVQHERAAAFVRSRIESARAQAERENEARTEDALGQIRVWMTRHDLLTLPGAELVDAIVAARDADHSEALDRSPVAA